MDLFFLNCCRTRTFRSGPKTVAMTIRSCSVAVRFSPPTPNPLPRSSMLCCWAMANCCSAPSSMPCSNAAMRHDPNASGDWPRWRVSTCPVSTFRVTTRREHCFQWSRWIRTSPVLWRSRPGGATPSAIRRWSRRTPPGRTSTWWRWCAAVRNCAASAWRAISPCRSAPHPLMTA